MKVKVLVFALFLSAVFADISFAKEKIVGGFGVGFGDVFMPEKAIGKAELTDGTPMHQFSPQTKFRSFSKYYVLTTPKTNKVYAIWGIGDIENTATCKKEQQLIMSLLTEKYGKEEKPGFMASMYDAEIISQGDR